MDLFLHDRTPAKLSDTVRDARLQKALAALRSIETDAGLDCGTIATDAVGRAIAACDSTVDAERLPKICRRYWPEHEDAAAG